MEIKYLKGDATQPIGNGNKVIVHVCNDIGAWGRGFVVAVSRRWKEPEKKFRAWAQSGEKFELGEVQFVQVEPTIWVANLIGQHDIKRKGNNDVTPVRYGAIRQGLNKVSTFAKEVNATVHMPRIGCGLSGGTWDQIEPMILNELIEQRIETYVYDFD